MSAVNSGITFKSHPLFLAASHNRVQEKPVVLGESQSQSLTRNAAI